MKTAPGVQFVQTLVSGLTFKRTQMSDIRAHLDIVKLAPVGLSCYPEPATIPAHTVMGIVGVDVSSQLAEILRVGITAHKANAGDVGTKFLDKLIERFGSKRHTDVVPKILAVAPRTVARAITDVNCQCHLVRNFLEYHPSVNVL